MATLAVLKEDGPNSCAILNEIIEATEEIIIKKSDPYVEN